MHTGHSHDHRLGARSARDRRALAASLALIVAFMAAEVVAALASGSLALLADAGHMLADAAALALALVAATLARKPPRGRWTFGFRRVEILAAQVNALTLLLVGALIVFAAVRRLSSPPEVDGGIVLAVALAGVAVNLAAAALLSSGSARSLNVRGAYLHVVGDLAAFAGTALAGLVILLTGWHRADPIVSLAVAGLIFWSSWRLLRESTSVLLESAPGDIEPAAVARSIVAQEHVVETHDLHVWTVTSGFPALSAHVLVEPGADCHAVRRSIERMLGQEFGLTHTTLQVDHARGAPDGVSLGGRLGRLRAPGRR